MQCCLSASLSVFSDVVFWGLSLRVGSRPAAGSNVVYLCLSSSSDDHLLSHSRLGTGMRGGARNKFCHYRASLVHLASSIVFSCGWFVGGSSTTILRLLVQIIRTFATVTIPVLCVLVNTLQYHDTVDLVQDSEKEDPQLVAEPSVGRNHGKTMGKSR